MVVVARFFINSVSKTMVIGYIGQVVTIYRLNKEKNSMVGNLNGHYGQASVIYRWSLRQV